MHALYFAERVAGISPCRPFFTTEETSRRRRRAHMPPPLVVTCRCHSCLFCFLAVFPRPLRILICLNLVSLFSSPLSPSLPFSLPLSVSLDCFSPSRVTTNGVACVCVIDTAGAGVPHEDHAADVHAPCGRETEAGRLPQRVRLRECLMTVCYSSLPSKG